MAASSEAGLARLNALPDAEARAALLRCCGSRRWVDAMVAGRPYADDHSLFSWAERTWSKLGPNDWLEAFAHHPRIGDRAALETRFAATRTSSCASRPRSRRRSCACVSRSCCRR